MNTRDCFIIQFILATISVLLTANSALAMDLGLIDSITDHNNPLLAFLGIVTCAIALTIGFVVLFNKLVPMSKKIR